MKVAIIGAGPAGLSCAYELRKKWINVEVFEASDHVGGMARSFDLWEQRVDVGPHRFFSKEKAVNDFFRELIGKDQTTINRLTRIYYNNRFFNYPLRMGNVLANLPLLTIFRILLDYAKQRARPVKDPKTFEEWVTNRFGKKLFELFFKSYSEKLWGIPCSHIDADWASQRIQGLSLWEAVKNAVFASRKNKHKTLVDQFAYPKNGMGTLYERCCDEIERRGGKVHLSSPVARILVNGNNYATGIELRNGKLLKPTT